MQAGGSIGISYEGFVASGSVGIDINTINQQVSHGNEFGSKQTTFRIGTKNVPLPIKMKMRPIYTAMDPIYWGSAYASLHIASKKTHLMKAFNDYKTSRGFLSYGNYGATNLKNVYNEVSRATCSMHAYYSHRKKLMRHFCTKE